MTLRFILAVSVVLTITAAPVCAEVMDKEPTVIDNWSWALLGGVLAVIAWRWRWWLGAIVSVAVLGGIYFMHQEINDPYVGPHIRREAGQSYITQFYWSALVGCALQMVAVYSGIKVRLKTGAGNRT